MWGGRLSPNLRKSIGSVTFIPLAEMTDEDWDFLDYDNLRETALNRLAPMITSGELVGFFDVRLLEKARAKKRYLWPARQKDVDDFEENEAPFFRHEADTDEIADEVDDIANARSVLGMWPKAMVLAAIREVMPSQQDQADRILDEADRNRDNSSFWLWVVVLIGIVKRALDVTWDRAVELVTDWLEDNQQIAAGRGLTPDSNSGRL